jgi:hypothetical protein
MFASTNLVLQRVYDPIEQTTAGATIKKKCRRGTTNYCTTPVALSQVFDPNQ